MRAIACLILLPVLPCVADDVDPLLAPIKLPATRKANPKPLDKMVTGTLDAAAPRRAFTFDAPRGTEVRVSMLEMKGNMWEVRLQRQRKNSVGKLEWVGAGGAAHVGSLLAPWSDVPGDPVASHRYRLSLAKWNAAQTTYKIRVQVIPRPDAGVDDAGPTFATALPIKPGAVIGHVGLGDNLDTYVLPNVAAGRRVQVRLVAIADSHARPDFIMPTLTLRKVHLDTRGRLFWSGAARVAKPIKKATTLPIVLEHTSDFPEHYQIQLGHALYNHLRYELRVTVGPGRDPKARLRYVQYAGGRYVPLAKGRKLHYGEYVFVEARFDIVPASVTHNMKLTVGGSARAVAMKRTATDPKLYRSPAILLKRP